MSNLNVMCSICSEFYKANDKVFTTTICGHLFHEKCLFRWLSQSKTCPQCRMGCHRKRVHRVYLNFGERTELDDEIDAAAAEASMYWHCLDDPVHPGAEEEVPENAVKSGTDPDGNDAYVARVYFHDDLLPAMFVPKKGGAYAPFNCKGHFLRADVEVLVNCECVWVEDSDGHVPDNALVTGYSETGENLYTGRAVYKGITLPGKIHPSHHVMYMAYQGQEVNTNRYEVLVRMPKKVETKAESPV